MKVCTKCNKEKEESELNTYWHSTHGKHYVRGYCKVCEALAKKIYKQHSRKTFSFDDDLWDGTEDYYKNPNEYVDEHQKIAVFRLMRIFGWKFHKGMWYKEPLKLKDGTWPTVKKSDRENGKNLPQHTIDKIRELFKEGKKNWEIAHICGVHSSTAYKYCNSDPNYKKTKYIPKKKKNEH